MAKKLHITDIDEEFIINSFRKDEHPAVPAATSAEGSVMTPEPGQETMSENGVTVEPVKEEPRRRKAKERGQDYQNMFLKEAAIPARIGKTVYVRKEYHERIQRIVRVIGKDEVSLFSYIDNVLAHHFATFQGEITELYDECNKSIF